MCNIKKLGERAWGQERGPGDEATASVHILQFLIHVESLKLLTVCHTCSSCQNQALSCSTCTEARTKRYVIHIVYYMYVRYDTVVCNYEANQLQGHI